MLEDLRLVAEEELSVLV